MEAANDGIVIATVPADNPDLGGGVLPTGEYAGVALAKLDPSGAHVWSTLVDGVSALPDGTTREPSCLTVADDGSATLGLSEGDSVDAIPSLSHFSPSGTRAWTHLGAAGERYPGCVADPSGNVYVVRAPASGSPNPVPVGLQVTKLGPTGGETWSTVHGTLAADEWLEPLHVSRAGADGIAVSAQLVGNVDLGDGMRNAAGAPATVIARVRADGSLLWSRLIRGSEKARLRVDPSGRVVVLGVTRTFVDTGTGETWVSRALEDFSYLAVYSDQGALEWLKIFDGVASDLAVGAAGDLYLADPERPTPFYFDGPEPVVAVGGNAWVARLTAEGNFASAVALADFGTYAGPFLSTGSGGVVVARSVSVDDSNGRGPDAAIAVVAEP
jgi:hypothetical protein